MVMFMVLLFMIMLQFAILGFGAKSQPAPIDGLTGQLWLAICIKCDSMNAHPSTSLAILFVV